MGYRLTAASDAHWRPSNAMKVMNTDVAGALELTTLSARFWRLEPGQANTRHRQREELEVYVLLEGTGRIRVGEEVLTLEPLSAVAVDANTVRQVFNDTDAQQLWLIFGSPRDTLTAQDAEWVYPDGRQAMPPELGGIA
jgi:quercetin dioxygenase-like cupin family protein